jgi:hypothetical protein
MEGYNENEMVNLCWTLMSGMIIWEIWKEWNRHIFRNEIIPKERIKEAIVSQIRETMQIHTDNMDKAQLTEQDSRILDIFHLNEWCNNIPIGRNPQLKIGSRNWTPPPSGFLKLNFDRGSKGNPGVVGTGGVIKDSGGNII